MENTDNFKAIVVDLDKTLLHTDKSLSAYTIDVLKNCKKSGMRIMVATARPLRTMEQYHNEVGFDAIVVSNGARVFCNGQQIDHGICLETAVRLLNALTRFHDLRITVETGSCAYSNAPIADYETVLTNDLVGIANTHGVLKILVHLDTDGVLAKVHNELPKDLHFTIANGYLMQIMHKDATKWNGTKIMLDAFDISASEVVYFGDDHDDVEPIKKCGLGIAVSNGIEEVKAAADHVVKSNDEDGVAVFIEKVLLKNR
jgi:Cof subfamily protein (haloacid dehalogenase superfamily)